MDSGSTLGIGSGYIRKRDIDSLKIKDLLEDLKASRVMDVHHGDGRRNSVNDLELDLSDTASMSAENGDSSTSSERNDSDHHKQATVRSTVDVLNEDLRTMSNMESVQRQTSSPEEKLAEVENNEDEKQYINQSTNILEENGSASDEVTTPVPSEQVCFNVFFCRCFMS